MKGAGPRVRDWESSQPYGPHIDSFVLRPLRAFPSSETGIEGIRDTPSDDPNSTGGQTLFQRAATKASHGGGSRYRLGQWESSVRRTRGWGAGKIRLGHDPAACPSGSGTAETASVGGPRCPCSCSRALQAPQETHQATVSRGSQGAWTLRRRFAGIRLVWLNPRPSPALQDNMDQLGRGE